MPAPAKLLALGLAAAAVPLLVCSAARAQNQLQNGRVIGGIAPVAAVPGTPSADPGAVEFDPGADLGGPTGSGSIRVRDAHPDPIVSIAARACISSVVPGEAYYGSADLRLAPGEAGEGIAGVVFLALDAVACGVGQSLATLVVPTVSTASDPRGVWIRRKAGTLAASSFVLPAATKSVAVVLVVARSSAAGELTVNFDNLFLGRVGRPRCKGKPPTIGGTEVADTILGTPGADVIVSFAGDDAILAGGGDDTICSGKGDDAVAAGDGNDYVNGGSGADTLYGDDGNDELKGGPGDDELYGDDGADALSGGTGDDDCHGGLGSPDTALGCGVTSGLP